MTPFDRWHRVMQIPGLEQSEKGVLTALAGHANDDGYCYPSIATLAEYASCSERSAQNAIKSLCAKALIEVSRPNGHLNRYRCCWDRWPERKATGNAPDPRNHCTPEVVAPVQPLHPTPATIAGDPRNHCTPTPATIAPEGAILRGQEKGPVEGGSAGATPTPPDVQPSPPPETQTIKGNQADVVLPKSDFVDFSPILALLVNVGIPAGYAASTTKKLVDAGITDPTDEVAMALDEFDLGRIVGSQRKGQTIKAFREAGWKPPKERGQSARGSPGGSTVVITETGERIEPRGPPGRPLTKSERQVEALQALKRKGGEDGRAVGNR